MAAGSGESEEARAALESLCEDYWYPLYAYVRSQATTLAYGIMDHMRSNRGVAAQYVTAGPDTAVVCNATSPLPSVQVKCWHDRIGATLPGGTGSIQSTGGPLYEVVVSWVDRENGGTAVDQTWTVYP